MAEPKTNELMEKIVSLCKRRGFIFQSSEIYGGINGFWDYGPLGTELKRNVKDAWWRAMTQERDDVVGLDASIIMHPKIWEASGHVETFADMMRECPLTKKRVRADQVEPLSGVAYHYAAAKDGTIAKEFLGKALDEWNNPAATAVVVECKSRISDIEQSLTAAATLLEGQNDKQVLTWCREYQEQLAQREQSSIQFAYLVIPGKNPESARKAARLFYQQIGINDPILVGGNPEKVENSTDYHPESFVRLNDARPFNLMFKTHYGPVESDENIAYLRPETAQAIFVQFKNVLDSSRVKVPFGICQIGKAFRNEVTPRNFTFRSREFEQMELEFFIKPDEVIEALFGNVAPAKEDGSGPSRMRDGTTNPEPNWGWEAWHRYWVNERVRFYEGIGLDRSTLGFHVQTPEELAHYARATTDILFKFPFSKKDDQGNTAGDELEGIAARSDFDLSQHARCSGKPMGVFDDEFRAAWGKLDEAKKAELSKRYFEARLKYLTKTGVEPAKAEKEAKADADGLAKGQYIPHVIEPSAGVDRLILALITNAYTEVTKTDEKGKSETNAVMRFHPRVAPIKVGVLPLLKNKPELVKKAQAVRDLLRPLMTVFYDDGGSIGRRYARQDEAGTPFCVTIDFDTLGEKPELLDTVTLRDRDTMQQTRVKIGELPALLLEKIR
jgi:glycyl-tRNA synthetase